MEQLHGSMFDMLAQVDRGDNKVAGYSLSEVTYLGGCLLDEKKGDV
ncbi:MAG TPA: hypothetical protein VFM54_04675 [Micromonosporaceae bacterium]|nr:hypothetical protein [Micromonosporaceae bacterium]